MLEVSLAMWGAIKRGTFGTLSGSPKDNKMAKLRNIFMHLASSRRNCPPWEIAIILYRYILIS